IEVASDPPLKWKQDDRRDWLVYKLATQIFGARREALLVSPYFVPGQTLTSRLVDLVQREDVTVGVVTNSLAANDVPAVHAGYASYRERLLDGGVDLYELRSQGSSEIHGLFGSSGASLHTKAFAIDGERGFIGSFNLGPRSVYLNTEMGVLFEGRHIARAVREESLFLAGPAPR